MRAGADGSPVGGGGLGTGRVEVVALFVVYRSRRVAKVKGNAPGKWDVRNDRKYVTLRFALSTSTLRAISLIPRKCGEVKRKQNHSHYPEPFTPQFPELDRRALWTERPCRVSRSGPRLHRGRLSAGILRGRLPSMYSRRYCPGRLKA